LEEMANVSMMTVEGLGVNSIELTHTARERGINRFDKEVIVVGHQAVRMTEPVEALASLVKKFMECDLIDVIEEEIKLTAISGQQSAQSCNHSLLNIYRPRTILQVGLRAAIATSLCYAD